MAFSRWKNQNSLPATAALATTATLEQKNHRIIGLSSPTVASVAIVTVATGQNEKVLTLELINDHHPKSAVTPVIQETVRQSEPLSEVLTNSVNLADHPQTVDGQQSPMKEVAQPPMMDRLLSRYAGFVKCQQCENLTLTGFCKVKPQYKPMPNAMLNCGSFATLKSVRIPVQNKPYSDGELGELMARYEKRLFHHLVKCELCVVSNHCYCGDGFATGNDYEAMLLCFDNAEAIHDELITKVVKTRLSGCSVLEAYQRPVTPPLPAKTHKYGITQADNDFLAHINDCPSCKPRGRLYCKEAKRLQCLIPD